MDHQPEYFFSDLTVQVSDLSYSKLNSLLSHLRLKITDYTQFNFWAIT